MKNALFVYGTLAQGESNQHILSPIGGQWQKAFLRGRLLPIGWGAGEGFPGLVIDCNADEIQGLIFVSEELPAHWERIDEFEGSEYQRTLTKVRLASDDFIDAYVYEVVETSRY